MAEIIHESGEQYRFKDNPLEEKFAKAWKQTNKDHHLLEYLLGSGNFRASDVSQEEATAAARAIQWLGSPVGQNFLKEVLKDERL